MTAIAPVTAAASAPDAAATDQALSLGKTNYCVQALLKKGWLKLQNFSGNANFKLYYGDLSDSSTIRVTGSLTLPPPRDTLQAKLYRAIELARQKLQQNPMLLASRPESLESQ